MREHMITNYFSERGTPPLAEDLNENTLLYERTRYYIREHIITHYYRDKLLRTWKPSACEYATFRRPGVVSCMIGV